MATYNPIEVLNEDLSKRFIGDCLKSQSNSSSLNVDDAVTSVINHLTGYSNFLAKGLFKIQEIDIKDRTSTLLKEQIEYVSKNPYKIREQVELCLIITSSYFYYVSCFKDNVNRFSNGVKTIFRCIRHLSVTEGMTKSIFERMENGRNEKWDVLRYPLALVLCSYIKEKSISKNIAESMIQSIITFGKHTSDIKNLMTTNYTPLVSKKIIDSVFTLCGSSHGEHENNMSYIKDFKAWLSDFDDENSIFKNITQKIPKLVVIGMEGSGKTTLLNNWGNKISNGKYPSFTIPIDGFELEFSEGIDFKGNDHLTNDQILKSIISNANDIIFIADLYKMVNSDVYKNNVINCLSKIQRILDEENSIIELNVSFSHLDKIKDVSCCHTVENLLESINPKIEIDNILFYNFTNKCDCIQLVKQIFYR